MIIEKVNKHTKGFVMENLLGEPKGYLTRDSDEIQYEVMTDWVIDCQSRWSVHYSQVIRVHSRLSEKFYRFEWKEGATECQEVPLDERLEDVIEVIPKEVTRVEYVKK